MNRKLSSQTAVGLDIGSQTVRCVIGQPAEEGGPPSIVGVGEAPNSGVRKGVVVDIDATVNAISQALEDAERISGIRVNHATVGLNGSHVVAVTSHGIIAVAAGAREITESDVARVQEAAAVIQLPPNREIIQAFARNYKIDGQDNIKEPLGMSGVRLEVDSCLVTAATPFIKNLGRVVSQAGVGIDGLITNPIAAAVSLVDKQRREQGSVLIDIGASTTGVAVFEEGDLLHVAVLPVGGANITNDLAIGLRTEIATAEKIKLEHVSGETKPQGSVRERNLKVKEADGGDLLVALGEVNAIARARLEEIFEMVNSELRKIHREGILPGGAVICGGTANLRQIEEVA
ncbi:cell division protein FtsA, partial [Candidatus Microgenomates bacterium]|nr:cell division protein FtsA [Candidatus Microgenomates bacterium]